MFSSLVSSSYVIEDPNDEDQCETARTELGFAEDHPHDTEVCESIPPWDEPLGLVRYPLIFLTSISLGQVTNSWTRCATKNLR